MSAIVRMSVFVKAECSDRVYPEIYHLACPASPPHYDHEHLWYVVVPITVSMPGFDRNTEVYGDPEVRPQNEDR